LGKFLTSISNYKVKVEGKMNDLDKNLLNTINLSDNIEYIKTLRDNSVDAIITDSPYGLGKEPKVEEVLFNWISDGYHQIKGKGFMGKQWDAFVPQPALWKESYRVLKPGGYLLSFFGTRTYDWGTMAIRLAGFEIRDCIQWIYGSGFPKSKACLKPANEPICVARKPGPIIELNINECRLDYVSEHDFKLATSERPNGINYNLERTTYSNHSSGFTQRGNIKGRFPSNVILDEVSADILDKETGCLNSSIRKQGSIRSKNPAGIYNTMGAMKAIPKESYNDFGGASRFFYVAKASPSEKKGLTHPTVKPVKLMIQLVKLYCPVGGVCLDPHFGTGATGEACLETGRNYIGIDNDPQSVKEANERIERWYNNPEKKQQKLF
jgi:DNA modification methylase